MKLKPGLLALCLTLAGCAAPAPILYPNEHLNSVGKEAAQRDIDACMELAEKAGAEANKSQAGQAATNAATGAAVGAASGAVGGAIAGSAASGSAIGAAGGATAGIIRWLFSKPQRNPAFENFVTQCLKDRGYQPMGWE